MPIAPPWWTVVGLLAHLRGGVFTLAPGGWLLANRTTRPLSLR